MRLGTARSLTVFGSLISITALVSGLLLGAATTFYPIDLSQVGGILKICLPTFFGYLGAATYDVFNTRRNTDAREIPRLGILLVGSFGVFYAICLSGLVAFYIINAPALEGHRMNPGRMEVRDLENVFTLGMSLLALTTSVVVSYIFTKQR